VDRQPEVLVAWRRASKGDDLAPRPTSFDARCARASG
jgi:hypothetical protein